MATILYNSNGFFFYHRSEFYGYYDTRMDAQSDYKKLIEDKK
jgi:hypothetical protein